MADYAIHDTTLIGTSNIIRKKEGSSALIDPADYPKRINLMGRLQEKTIVSWPVSSFSDGADDVPTKSIVVTIPPTFSGVSEVVEKKAGRNWLNPSIVYEQTNIYTYDEVTKSVTVNRSDDSAWTNKTELPIKKGTYTINNAQGRVSYRLRSENYAIDHSINASSGTITLSVDDGIKFKFGLGSTYPFTAQYMLELGSTAHAYEPYITPTQYTANLGRTIYGGTADIVNGVGKDTCTKIKISDLNWTYYTAGTNPIFYANNVPNMKTYSRGAMPNIIIDGYTTRTAHSRSNLTTNMANMECSAIENGPSIAFRNDSYTSVSAMLADLGDEYIVYEVATPTDFTFDGQEIDTMLGYNAFWSDEGDTEVTYRSSGTITPVVPTLITKTITENGTYSAEDDDADGYDEVTVNVSPNVGTKNITENGTYTASADSLDGYSSVTVAVPTAPSGMVVMDFTNISSPFTLNGVSYGSTGAVFDNTSDYIDLPFFHAGMEIEIDVASMSLGQNANRRFFSSYRNQGFLYRNSNVWSFYNGSWYDTNISDSGYFDNSTVKIVVDSNNYWHIYKDDVLIFEPAGACAISEPAIGSKDGSCINNATITGVRMKEATS